MNIGIYIYDQAEVLDFSGLFEVLSVANSLGNLAWNFGSWQKRNVLSKLGSVSRDAPLFDSERS